MTKDEIRFINRSMLMYLAVPVFMAVLVVLVGCFCFNGCTGKGKPDGDTITVRVDSIRDTVYVEVHDTVPVVKQETVVRYVKIPVQKREEAEGEVKDTVDMAVIQREYSDDSTYTAYVSGLNFEEWPKLDSITVRQRNIETIVERTITVSKKQSRWGIGITGGYSFGLADYKFQPYIGFGFGYYIPL